MIVLGTVLAVGVLLILILCASAFTGGREGSC